VVNSKLRSDFSGSAVNVSRRGLSGVTGTPLTANWPPLSAAFQPAARRPASRRRFRPLSFAKTTSDSFNAPKILPPFQDCELFGDALPDYLYSQADGTSRGRPVRRDSASGTRKRKGGARVR